MTVLSDKFDAHVNDISERYADDWFLRHQKLLSVLIGKNVVRVDPNLLEPFMIARHSYNKGALPPRFSDLGDKLDSILSDPDRKGTDKDFQRLVYICVSNEKRSDDDFEYYISDTMGLTALAGISEDLILECMAAAFP